MPRLSRFYGISIYMHYADHAPPHVHAVYAGRSAAFAIRDGSVLAGRMPRRATRLARSWILRRGRQLEANWTRATRGEPLVPVEPLE